MARHESASPLYLEEQNRWLSECSCGWEQNAATRQEARIALDNHKVAMDELEERIARERGTLRLSSENPRNEREQLELRLRAWLDDDEAVSAVQEMLGAGWRPASELASVEQHADEMRQLAHRQGETIFDLTNKVATLRHALKTARAECELSDHIAEFIGDALAVSNESDRESEKTWGPERMRHDPL